MTRLRRALALWLLRKELDAEWHYVVAAHDGVENTAQKWVERYWMGRVTSIDRLMHGSFAADDR